VVIVWIDKWIRLFLKTENGWRVCGPISPVGKDIQAPIDKTADCFFLRQNFRDPVTEPEEMMTLWKILHLIQPIRRHARTDKMIGRCRVVPEYKKGVKPGRSKNTYFS
jgi:hypothetical protein